MNKMKIRDLIDLLRSQDPEGTIHGVEGLTISAPLLIEGVEKKKPLGKYVKGHRRLSVADAPGSVESIAERFNIPISKVMEIKSLRSAGKI